MDQLMQMPVTAVLIIANVIISFAAWGSEPLMNRGLFHVGPMRHRNQWDRGITSGFLHGNVPHLGMNMIAFFSFGGMLEQPEVLGSENMTILYFVALIGGSAWSYLENFRNDNYRALGASGAVSGVIIAACLFNPLGQVNVMGIWMPSVVFAVGFLLISAKLSTHENTIIGHDAHLGGALAGGITAIIMVPEVWPYFIRQTSTALGLM